MKRIHFVRDRYRNYRQVQNNIFGEIKRYLPFGACSSSYERSARPGTGNFTLFIRLDADILMSHGAADKNYMLLRDDDGGFFLNRFKHVLVPGPWLKNRLLAEPGITLGEDRIHVVGWPRNDYLLRLAHSPWRRLKRRLVTKKSGKMNVLWAPTHDFRKQGPEQKSTSSYPDFDGFTRMLAERYDYNVSLHPRNREKKRPTAELLVEADAVISDFGTIVYEAWSLGKPVIFPRWILQDRIAGYLPGSAEAHIFSQRLGYHAESIGELVDIIDSAPCVDENVKLFMEEYLPAATCGNSARTVAELLLRLE